MSSKSQVNFDVMQQTHIKNRKNNRVVYWLVQLNPSPVYPQLHLQPWVAGRHTAFSLHPPLSTLHKYCQKSAVYTQHNVVRIYWRSGAATWRYHHNCFGTVIISDKGGCTCFCPCSFVCLSVCLSVSKITQKTRAWIKCCVSTDVGTWMNWLTFQPDPDHSPGAGTRLLSPIS